MNKSMSKEQVIKMVPALLVLFILIAVGTYAFDKVDLLGVQNVGIVSNQETSLRLVEGNKDISISGTPMSDTDGKAQTTYYDFTVEGISNVAMDLKYYIYLSPKKDGNTVDSKYVKVYLTKVENNSETVVVNPSSISSLDLFGDDKLVLNNTFNFTSNVKTTKSSTYRLRAWLSQDAVSQEETNPIVDKTDDGVNISGMSGGYQFNIGVSSYDMNPNAPALLSNMIPVYYDSASDSWKKADKTNKGSSWYNYNDKMWANAVTVTSTNRQTYINASVGTTIPMNDINTMWVWIPRYTYTYLNTNTPQEINVKFESGTASTGTIKCTDAVTGTSSTSETCTDTTNNGLVAGTSTYTHPAFWWDKNDNNIRETGEELTGIWVGKFEVSSDTTCTASNNAAVGSGCNLQTIRPEIKPNVTSWRGAQVGTFFNGIQKMRESGNKYGFATTDETHMMKNMEWGAVTYLSHSKYGINKEIAINSANTFTTGCGPQSAGSTTSGATCNSYTTTLGQSASTTGNVYGVYDMSGGAFEYMMGNMVWNNGQQMSGYQTGNNYNSAFTGILYDGGKGTSFTGTYAFPSKRYYDKYSYGTSETEYTRGKLGDATKEMASTGTSGNWYSDRAYFVNSNDPWVLRGGNYGNGAVAGAFDFDDNVGFAYTYSSARAVLLGPGA